ncbi:hypothetical protein D3C77_569290 [compost metagenome]
MMPRGKQFSGLAPCQACTDGKAVSQRLGQGDDVRHDPRVLEAEPGAGATHSGLHFIDHHQPIVLIAQLAQGL